MSRVLREELTWDRNLRSQNACETSSQKVFRDQRPDSCQDPPYQAVDNFHFIVTNNTQKADPKTRKLIRSHVMRGKNRVKSSNKANKLVHLVASKPTSVSLVNVPVDRLLCSKFAAIPFAAEVEPALIEDILTFASMSTEAMFLLNKCIKPATSDTRQIWFGPMLSDAAYLHAACFTIQTFFDGLLARTRSLESVRRDHIYYAKAIRLLQQRLEVNDDSVRLADSTIMTVLTLSGHAYSMGDYRSAEHHVDGLLKLVSIRGPHNMFHNTRILIEIVRSDLGMAVDRIQVPALFSDANIPWSLFPHKASNCVNQLKAIANPIVNTLNYGLGDIWVIAMEFCTIVNAAADGTGLPIAEEMFLHYMGAIMYRLLHQCFEEDCLNEAFRLALIAFLSPLFLNWNRIELPDCRFNGTYRDALSALTLTVPEIPPQSRLWLFMVAALSMSHESDHVSWLQLWLHTDMGLCGIHSWDDMKSLLGSFLWVDMVYDAPGQAIVELILSKQDNRRVTIQ